jgi:hypothetical protein
LVDPDGRPSIEPRTNLGYAVGVYTSLSYTIALHPRSTAAHLALAPAPNRPRCREVASDMPGSCIAGWGRFPESRSGERGTAARPRPGCSGRPWPKPGHGMGPTLPHEPALRKRLGSTRASVGLMEHRT